MVNIELSMFGVVSLDHLIRIPPFGLWGEIGGRLGNWSKQQKRGGNFWFLSPLFALWITSYICLSISANRGVPSIYQSRQSRLLICLMVIWKDIVFDLSVFIYTSNIAFFIENVKSRYLVYLNNLPPSECHSFDYFLE